MDKLSSACGQGGGPPPTRRWRKSQAIATRLNRSVKDLVVIVLDRPRHEKLVEDIRRAGARIRLISAAICRPASPPPCGAPNVHAVMGIGGAPEGVLTAAAPALLNGICGASRADEGRPGGRMKAMGISDPKRIYTERDLPGPDIIFAGQWCDGCSLLNGVRFFGPAIAPIPWSGVA